MTMRTQHLLVATSLLLALGHASRAEDAATTFSMPCAQVVKLGFEKFMDEYSKRTKDYSTAGQKQGYQRYAECKRADNNRRMKSLPPLRQAQLTSIRRNLGQLEAACWGMQYLASGGGTMWGQMAAASTALREDYVSSLIGTLNKKQSPQPAARRKAVQLLTRSRMKLATLQKAPQHEYGPHDRAEQKKMHDRWWSEANIALRQLQSVVAVLPDTTALQLTQRMESAISAVGEFE